MAKSEVPVASVVVRNGAVQSVERALELVGRMAVARGPVGLSTLAAETGLPLPTIHRLLRTLIQLGYVRQDATRRYALGPRLISLGEAAVRSFGEWSSRHLRKLADLTGESANLATLDRDEVLYLAQVAGRHSMRMFTEPGRRVMPHCTAVGKAMLSQLPAERVRDILARVGMPRFTPTTIVEPEDLIAQLETVRERGFAVDEGEQEIGVRCVAACVPGAPTLTAISVSAPVARLTDEAVPKIIPVLMQTAAAIGADIEPDDFV